MKLINMNSNEVVVVFQEGHPPEIKHQLLADNLRLYGITIPVSMRPRFHNKRAIFPNDPDFERAFREVYYPYAMDPNVFKWEEGARE